MAKPSILTPEMSEEICRRIAGGEMVVNICRDDHLPARATIYAWVADTETEREDLRQFQKDYKKALSAWALASADDCVVIADDGSDDMITKYNSKGEEYESVNQEVIQRSKLRVDVRLKLMEKRAPEAFGASLALTGPGGGPIQTKEVGARDIGRRMAFLLAMGLLPEEAEAQAAEGLMIEHDGSQDNA